MRPYLVSALLAFLALNTGWFIVYSAQLGWAALASDGPQALSRVFVAGAPVVNAALAVHMMAGAVLTVGAPLQAMPLYRRTWPGGHRRTGRALVVLALVTGFAGLFYIARVGTVGGWWMSLWFAIYGAAMALAAWRAFHHARRRQFDRHFDWATRLVVLAVGSWIFRMHYAVWYAFTDGAGSRPDFTGPFDQATAVAFFVPYLLVAELLLRRRRVHPRRAATD